MENNRIPHITMQNDHPVLLVDDQPMILLAGEVHNSDSSSPTYMEHIWDIAGELGMNTLLLPVSWEMTEPEEGVSDYSVPKALINQARKKDMHIVFLWFGSWKNAECMYAPSWVKRDLERFPRAQIVKGQNKAGRKISDSLPIRMPYASLSYLSEEGKKADSRAFASFMQFLKEYDGDTFTVVAVQVENETGLLGAAREMSDAADALFYSEVPSDFVSYMRSHTDSMCEEIRNAVEKGKESGNWEEVFTDAAEELFSAYYVSSYVNSVAEAGKEVYPLPMSANCWLDKGDKPGSYPTGGPIRKVHEVWDFCAPAIDAYCPDIYVPQFKEVCDAYAHDDNPLFIPEAATHSYAAGRLLYTVGHYHAMCYSPFGFDDIGKPFTAVQGFLFGMDVTDPAIKTPQNFEEYAAIGQILKALMPELAKACGTENLKALSAESDPPVAHPSGNPFMARMPEMDFGNFSVSVTFQSPLNPRKDGACLCLKVSEEECWLVGNACGISMRSNLEDQPHLDLLSVEEYEVRDGALVPLRRLNGDETASMAMNQPSVWHMKFFTYK